MYGSGVRIYIAKMPIVNTSVITLYIQVADRVGCAGAVAGAADRGAFVVPLARGASLTTGAAAWASAS